MPDPNQWVQTAGPGGNFTGGAIPCNQRLRCDIVNMTTGELMREGYVTFRPPTSSERNDNLVVGEIGVLYSRADQRSYDLMEILICPTRISNGVGDMIYNGMARPNEDLYYFKFYYTGQNGVKNGSHVWGTFPRFFNGTHLEFGY